MLPIFLAAAAAQSTPSPYLLHFVGRPYSASRPKLRRSGWSPVITSLRFADGRLIKRFGAARQMLDAGFVEIADCSGTGLNFCTFIWKRRGKCIQIVTQGEYYAAEPRWPKIETVKRGRCDREE